VLTVLADANTAQQIFDAILHALGLLLACVYGMGTELPDTPRMTAVLVEDFLTKPQTGAQIGGTIPHATKALPATVASAIRFSRVAEGFLHQLMSPAGGRKVSA
jgi:hypothetical protein